MSIFAGGQSGENKQENVVTFGLCTRDFAQPFLRAMIDAAKKRAKELGVKLVVLSPNNDALKHLEIIDNFITMKIDGFISGNLIDANIIIPGIKKMNDAGIPVIALDESPKGGKVEYFISCDIKESSKRAAETMIQELRDKNNGQIPKGVIIEVMGDLLEGFAGECSKGFHSVVDQYKELTVIQGEGGWNNDKSFSLVSDFLTRFGDQVVAIYVHTPDVMGTGVAKAVKESGLDSKKIVKAGYCIGPEGIELIKNGDFQCIVEQPITIAVEMAMDLLYDIVVTKEPVPKIGDTLVEEGALWSPAEVLKNPFCDGAYIKLSAPRVPQDISTEDSRLWENQVK
jgi:ribose transport system substrate-binding protein